MPDANVLEHAELSRSVRFVKFLREAVAIKTKRVLEVQKYPSVTWFADLPRSLQEVRSPLITENWGETDPDWMKVARVQEPPRPAPPDICLPWLTAVDLDSPDRSPVLNAAYESRDEQWTVIQVSVSPDAQDAWDHYISGDWARWAQKAAVARQVRPVYQKLFSIHQQMQAAADTFDLFVGVGLFHSKIDPEQLFRRHLLAFPAELSLDERTGTLRLGPSNDFTTARIEADFIPTSTRARLQPQVEKLQSDLESVGAGLSNRTTIDDIVTRLITPVSAVTRYVPDLSAVDAPAKGAVVSFGAALILRPRSTRSLEALLERIEKDASGEEPRFPTRELPIPWRKMVEDGSAWDAASAERTVRPTEASTGRVYFPLPSNEEQSRIVHKAHGSPGVVVQGPPGTGKSHTIANLISHYLAMGRRVLVTAQSPQALEVLRDKMPEELQQLCVTLLGDSRVSDRALRRSVDAILSRQQDFRPKDHERRIQALERQLIDSETHLSSLERTLHDSRATETEVKEPVTGYRGTRAMIARQLRDERSTHLWLRDAIPYDTTSPTYPSGWETLATYHASLDAGARAKLVRVVVPSPFTSDQAVDAIKTIDAAKSAVGAIGAQPQAKELPQHAGTLHLQTAEQWLRKLAELEGTATAENSAWVAAVRKVLLRNSATWETRLQECRAALKPLTNEVLAATLKVEVVGKSVPEARRDLARLEEHYAGGGARRTFWGGKPAVVKETDWVEQAVSVEGLAVQTPEEIGKARRGLEGWALLDAASCPWSQWPPASEGSPKARAAALNYRADLLESLLGVGTDGTRLQPDLRQWVAECLDAAIPTASLAASVGRKVAEMALASAREHRDTLVRTLRQAIGHLDVVPALRDLLDGLTAESTEDILLALASIQDEISRRAVHKEYGDFLGSVRKAAPLLADDVVAAEGTPGFRAAFFGLEAAWQHRRAHDWLETMLSEGRIEATHRAARDERQRQQETLSDLTVERAWASALARINDLQRATLTSWAKAVAAIPQTGKSVFTKRAHAQRLLGSCLASIPAWVVSLSRLYETVEPVPGLFDVVIVDEASQCWIDALVLFYLAKQVIVVGDDRQISPTVVGVADTQIEDLAKAYLQDFQFRSNFSLTSSLFDHGRTYLSDGVPLREHFRCVPEIIGFSNALCYTGNLIPLRQVGRNRLEPLKRTFLPQGLRHGDINEVEARAIVDAIAACHDNPDYEDADFGVICLQGDQQGDRIEQLLLERIGPDVFTKRRLRCGNPYAFQGDERDVMFMSMVVAPNQAHQTLTAAMYEQRFNVAMSRARDQAWLFHSVKTDELGANCLRRRVLDHFTNPPDPTIGGSSLDVHHLQLAAGRADRSKEKAPVPFDSWFEVDVALALLAKGYTLTAQVRIAHKRIDLVVEGEDGVRLAVECDGDAWHGVEHYDADLARQRQLERAGWRFVRVRECLFYADEERAVQEVIDGCEELDIAPRGGSARPSIPSSPVPAPSVAAESAETVSLSSSHELRDDDPVVTASDDDAPADQTSDSGQDGKGRRAVPERDYPDPRIAPLSNVRSAVLDIVTTHGPLTKSAIYCHYRDGCPRLERTGKNLRHAVNSALGVLERMKRVEWRDEGYQRRSSDVVYRLPNQPWVNERPFLGRDLDDVPLSELAAAILADGGNAVTGDAEALESLLKDVARQYGALRFREQARARLSAAADLAFDNERLAAIGGLR